MISVKYLPVQENKILHVQHMLQLGLQLVVHPEAFVVHYPHSYSASELTVKADAALQHKVRNVNATLLASRRVLTAGSQCRRSPRMHQQAFPLFVDPGECCRAQAAHAGATQVPATHHAVTLPRRGLWLSHTCHASRRQPP